MWRTVRPERPDAVGRPARGALAKHAGGARIAARGGEGREHPERFGEEGIGIGVVVAEAGLEELDVVAIDTQRILALPALQKNVCEAEGLELLDLGMQRDRFL